MNIDPAKIRGKLEQGVFMASILLLCALAMLQGKVLSIYFADQHYLDALARAAVDPSASKSEQAKELMYVFKDEPEEWNKSYILFPVFKALRATPRQGLEQGACSSRVRSMIALLRARGIEARRWVLYSPSGKPSHAVLEADVETGPMVLDPLFGIWFERPGGGYYGIEDLRNNPSLLTDTLHREAPGRPPFGFGHLHLYPVQKYGYARATTLNWEHNLALHYAYRAMRPVVGSSLDRISVPNFTEQPALIIAFGLIPIEALLLFIVVMFGRKLLSTNISVRSAELASALPQFSLINR